MTAPKVTPERERQLTELFTSELRAARSARVRVSCAAILRVQLPDGRPGQFPACRYEQLENTSGRPGAEAGLDAPLFACHKTAEGREQACAGWLATVGREHLGVRLAVATGRLPVAALDPGDGWPPLFDTYIEMAATQAAHDQPEGE